MKRILSIIAAVFLLAALTACGSNSQTGEASEQAETTEIPAVTESQEENIEDTSNVLPEAAPEETSQETEPESEATSPAAQSDVLVVYFSATGTTKGVAEKIAAVTGGDMYEILAAQPYTADDLNYNDQSSRSTREQNDKSVRPEIGSEALSLDGYTTVYLGFPIWWGEEPRILDTFAEEYSFEGITVIPFCTSGGSGIGRSGSNMEDLAESGTWLEGKRFSGNVTEADIQSWIDGLK